MLPGQRFKMAMEMLETIRDLAKAGILKRHPGISEEELRKWLGAISAWTGAIHQSQRLGPGNEGVLMTLRFENSKIQSL